jgi:hypothetical protein
LKRSFWRSDFSSNIIETPKSSGDGAEKIRERKRKRKAPKVSSNKGEVNILRGEVCFNFKTPFQCDPIPPPLHHTISKTLSKIIEKISLTLFGPYFSLAIYMTWVVPFFLTHELHIFNL